MDLLILMDAPTFVGCVAKARLIGVIEAKQKEKDGSEERNDRLIAVAAVSRRHQSVQSLKELPEELLREIEHFFVSYNQLKEKEFVPLGRFGPKRALKLVKKGNSETGKGEALTETPHACQETLRVVMKKSPYNIFKLLGPGLITGASDDDPSGIATYSQVGASLASTCYGRC